MTSDGEAPKRDTEMSTTQDAEPPPERTGRGEARRGKGSRRGTTRLRRASRRAGNQVARVVLLCALVVLSGMAIGYAAGYPLRYVDYEASSAVSLEQSSLSGTIDVRQSLVAQTDLPEGWTPADPALGSFGVLGADICGETLDTPTPLSAREAAVFTKPGDNTTVIAQALRVDQWKSAVEYVDDVRDALEECENFYRVDGENRVKVISRPSDLLAPITDHVGRVYQSPDGVQVWSMMAVGDVIIAIQYLGLTPPQPETFVTELEQAVLARIDPADFAPQGLGGEVVSDGDATPESDATPGSDATPESTVPATTALSESGGAADESGQ